MGARATVVRNTVSTLPAPEHRFTITTRPTAIQQKAFDLLGVSPDRNQEIDTVGGKRVRIQWVAHQQKKFGLNHGVWTLAALRPRNSKPAGSILTQ
jgi:hypothetical protein